MAVFAVYPEILGSDSIHFLDARWSLPNMASEAERHAKQLNNLGKGITKYRIVTGTILENRPLFEGKLLCQGR
jgi:hypothetical protein